MKKRLKSTVPEGMQKIPMNFCIAESASRRRYEPDPMLGVSLNHEGTLRKVFAAAGGVTEAEGTFSSAAGRLR